jgi:hypothetical protein
MEKNDIHPVSRIKQVTMFEGVLASPPSSVLDKVKGAYHKRTSDWASVIPLWKVHDMPMRSLSDCVNRRGIATHVITFLSPDAVDPIEKWLIRKGVSTPVMWYPSIVEFASDLVYDRSVAVVYTPHEDYSAILGLRGKVVSPDKPWSI